MKIVSPIINVHVAVYIKKTQSKEQKKNVRKNTLGEYLGKIFGYLEVIGFERNMDNCYDTVCLCHGCNSIVSRPFNSITRIQSCGCKTAELLSLSHGGTGIPYENKNTQEVIRESQENRQFILEALKLSNYKCYITGENSNNLEVHHIISMSSLLKQHNITKDNWKDYKATLFDLNNVVVLEKSVHRKFHKIYGNGTDQEQLSEYSSKYICN